MLSIKLVTSYNNIIKLLENSKNNVYNKINNNNSNIIKLFLLYIYYFVVRYLDLSKKIKKILKGEKK